MYRVVSYQVADSIDIKNCKTSFKAELIYGDSEELFYHASGEHYIYIFKYGVVSFLNYDAVEISGTCNSLRHFAKTGLVKP